MCVLFRGSPSWSGKRGKGNHKEHHISYVEISFSILDCGTTHSVTPKWNSNSILVILKWNSIHFDTLQGAHNNAHEIGLKTRDITKLVYFQGPS